MPAGVGGGSGLGAAGWFRVVRAGRGDAARRRQLRFSARGVWPGPYGAADVVSLCLANSNSGATQPFLWCNWVLAVCLVPVSAGEVWREGSFGRTGDCSGHSALSQNHFDRKNIGVSMGGCGGHNSVAHLGRSDAFSTSPGFHLRAGGLGFFLALLRGAGLGYGEHNLYVLGLLQHLPPRRRDSPARTQHSPRYFSLHRRHRHFVSRHADEHPGGSAVAAGAGFPLHRERICREAVRRGSRAVRHCYGALDCIRVGLFLASWLFASALFGGARWKFLSRFRARASEKTLPARVVAVSGRGDVYIQLAVPIADRNRCGFGDALDCAIHRPGDRRDIVAQALACGAAAV